MRIVIAKRTYLYSIIALLFFVINIIIMIKLSYNKNIIDYVFSIVFSLSLLSMAAKGLFNPKEIIVKDGNYLIIYPNSKKEVKYPLAEVLSASTKATEMKEMRSIIINTRSHGLEVGHITHRKKVVEEINKIIKKYKEINKIFE